MKTMRISAIVFLLLVIVLLAALIYHFLILAPDQRQSQSDLTSASARKTVLPEDHARSASTIDKDLKRMGDLRASLDQEWHALIQTSPSLASMHEAWELHDRWDSTHGGPAFIPASKWFKKANPKILINIRKVVFLEQYDEFLSSEKGVFVQRFLEDSRQRFASSAGEDSEEIGRALQRANYMWNEDSILQYVSVLPPLDVLESFLSKRSAYIAELRQLTEFDRLTKDVPEEHLAYLVDSVRAAIIAAAARHELDRNATPSIQSQQREYDALNRAVSERNLERYK